MQNDLFEKWYIENYPYSSLERKEDGRYFRKKAALALEAWQASANRKGYKLVPMEPTDEMINAASNALFDHDACTIDVYKAMIGAVDEL